MRRAFLATCAAAAVLVPSADGSIWIANGARGASLKVDARGNAQVTWRDTNGTHTMLVPRTGRVLPGGRVGRDVSRAAPKNVPFAVVVRRTPDGKLWALQQWRGREGARELHFARWTGAPTLVTGAVEDDRLVGRVTFHGRPVSGYSPTTAGRRLRVAAYVDALQGATWNRITATFPRADGSFRLFLRPSWQAERYRISVYGKNAGWTFMPDAFVEVGAG